MLKFEGNPNMNNTELNPGDVGADVVPGEQLDGGLIPEELEKFKAEGGQEQKAEVPELPPEEQLKNLEGEVEAKQKEVTRLSESIEGIKFALNAVREKLDLPPTEEDPPSVSSEKDKLVKLEKPNKKN